MKDVGITTVKQWHPLSYFGFEDQALAIDAHTVINTWLVLLFLCILCIVARFALKHRSSISRYLVLQYVRSFIDLCSQSFGFFSYHHTAFIVALFTFIVLCNIIAVIPWIEEPTKELNTTLALGLIAFFYIQYYGIKAHGLKAYIKEYFTPIFIMFPLHIIGKLSTIVSMSFRLFGNIFGGSTILHIYNAIIQNSWISQTAGIVTGFNLLMLSFFILFEGVLQAFVFTMLTITYLAIAMAHDEEIGEMT